MPKLIITTGEDTSESHVFGAKEITIGRSPDATITLKDLRASRKHAKILKLSDDFYLEDLKSQNGILVNGKKLKLRIKLKDKDSIRIGNTLLVFSINADLLEPGGMFSGYHIKKLLIEEDTGNIYLAEQVSLKRNVLLWVLPLVAIGQDKKQIEVAKKVFVQQIAYIANLFHRNLMMVMDFAATDQYCYCSFEEVDMSSNVKTYLQKHPSIPLTKGLNIAIQVASGMEYAHKHEILHLHLTSRNILIQGKQQERVVLTEFGVSKFLSETTIGELTKAMGIMGVSEYISPEQITGDAVSCPQTDIYSFGCFLYHFFSGNPPFNTKRPYELAQLHVSEMPPSLEERCPDLPKALCELIESCMAKEINMRPSSFSNILTCLRTIKKKREFDMVMQDKGLKPYKNQLKKSGVGRWILLSLLATSLGILSFFSMPFLMKWIQ